MMMNESQLERYFENFTERRRKLEESAQQERQAGIAPDLDHLVFSVGEEEFAVPMTAVRATVAVPRCTSVPFLPPHHRGIANVRGEIVSVVDLRIRMGAEAVAGLETALVVIEREGDWLGFVVDSVNRVLSVKNEQELSPVRVLDLARVFEGASL